MEEGNCYLNLSGDTQFEGNGELAIESLVASLCSLKNVERVQIVVDGELWEELDGVPVLQPRVFLEN
ncbi:MAG: GerMN domain-containing protein [Oscillospiraceae bacterium]|nr:GerMN domain-containing protein [Oscillospiraceae bacterium]